MMRPSMLRAAAIASLLSAVTTAVLIYGPDAQVAADFAARAELHDEPLHLYKRWVLFFHPQFAFVGAIGVALVLYRKSPALVLIGLFYLAVWAITEMTQQAYAIDALNQYWRPAWLGAENAPDRAAYFALLSGFDGIYDSLYFVLLFGFGVGSLLFGLAFLGGDAWHNSLGAILLFIGSLSLAAFSGYYLGMPAVNVVTDWIYANVYGPVQTGVRLALGVWLWRCSAQQSLLLTGESQSAQHGEPA